PWIEGRTDDRADATTDTATDAATAAARAPTRTDLRGAHGPLRQGGRRGRRAFRQEGGGSRHPLVEGPERRPRRGYREPGLGPHRPRGRAVVPRRRHARLRHAEHRLARPVAGGADRARGAGRRERDDPAPDVTEEPSATDRLDLADWR